LSGKDSFHPLRALLRRISGSWLLLPALVLIIGFGVGLALSAVLGTGDDDGTRATAPAPKSSGPSRDPRTQKSFLTKVVPPPAGSLRGARPPAAIARRVRSMSPEEKAAQLMLVGFGGVDATAPVFKTLRARPWGGLMLEEDNYQGAQQLRVLNAELRAQYTRVRQPQPFIGAVQQGGEWNALPALPPAQAPAETSNVSEAAEIARTTARTFKRLGMDAIWAPSLEVGAEDGGAMGTRAFSDEPGQVAAYAQSALDEYSRAGLLSAPGRFPGLGAAAVAPEEGPPNVGLSLEELRTRDLVPFRAAIRAGTPAIVVGHGLYVTDDFVVPASLSSAVSTNLLRNQLGFRGVAIADDLTLPAVTTSTPTPEAALRSIAAGVDMVFVPGPSDVVNATYTALVNGIKRGGLKRRRVDEALTRALIAKNDLGLLRKRKAPRAGQPALPGAVGP
jgi:beta-N-acetylhexosaminidase